VSRPLISSCGRSAAPRIPPSSATRRCGAPDTTPTRSSVTTAAAESKSLPPGPEDATLEAPTPTAAQGAKLGRLSNAQRHLDELNSRAQAIRHQHGDLGEHGLRVVGRPYALHAGGVYAIDAGMTVTDLAESWDPYLTIGEGLYLAAQALTRGLGTLSCCAV